MFVDLRRVSRSQRRQREGCGVFISYLPVVSDQALAQPELSEDVHHDLHGGVVGDGEGAHVQDGAQFEGTGAVGRQGGCVLGEVNPGVQHDALLLATSIFC